MSGINNQKAKKMNSDKSVADEYQVLSDLEHILLRPGMYIGAPDAITDDIFICDIEDLKIVKKKISYSQGFERLYEEILLNAYDHTVRDGTDCDSIDVNIDQDNCIITITNNGLGIPIVKKEELNCYLPEMLFGMLRSGSNYSSDERILGGQNGMGGSLANIFSKSFTVETIDSIKKKKYIQSWTEHMSVKTPPVITAAGRNKPYTKITFQPDLEYFKLESLSDDMMMLMKKRLIDIGYVTKSKVKTSFNGVNITIKKPEEYMKLYSHPENMKFIIDDTCERWSVGVVLSDDGFQHSGFVNGIHTSMGGSHIDHVTNMISKEIIEKLKTKKIIVKPCDIKNKMFVFVRSDIVNPVFDSQSKECLKTPKSKFGSEFIMSPAFKKKILASDILKSMTEVSDMKKMKDLSKTSGTKTSRMTGVDGLEDATNAGTSKNDTAKLILTEGLSARTFAISALNVIGRDKYGVFPLKGKLLNVRNVVISRVAANDEIKNIVKIIGLKYDLKYETDEDMKTLRYGGIISLTDSDADGYHITGLIINFVHHFWPALIEKKYLSMCITPIVKAIKGKTVIQFYTLNDYEEWLKTATGIYKTKYFKGLGTSTPAEAREALKDIDNKLITFERDEQCDEHVSLAFNSKRADDRKLWLLERYDPLRNIDRKQRQVDVSDFINYELSHFSTYDCARSLPNVMDGLKVSQRKILYVAMKYATKNEIKVGQLGPMVSEKTDYHHGEASLLGAIIGMAQDFAGSNNINLLEPLGQFGSRIAGGNDAASPRYIFTKTNPETLKIFDSKDSPLLKYLNNDGVQIEPEWFAPILPMILINGCLGIGTGFSTSVLSYNPADLIKYIIALASGKKPRKTLMPWYRGFKGQIKKNGPGKYITFAKWVFDDKKKCLHITDLPIGVWTDNYKAFCESKFVEEESPIKDIIYGNTDVIVDFKIYFKTADYERIKALEEDELVKEFKLSSKLSETNMYLFNAENRIQKFDTVYDIIDYWFALRMGLYINRKINMLEQLSYEMLILSNKAKFIRYVKSNKINQQKMTEAMLLKALESDFAADPRAVGNGLSKYEYLVGMSYKSFTDENADKMDAAVKAKQSEMEKIEKTTHEDMWITDLKSIVY